MKQNSILTGRGLYESITSNRQICLGEFVKRSQVVFIQGDLFGHLFTEAEFDGFVSHSSVVNKRAAKTMWTEHAKPFGATGRKVFPIHLVDGLIDIAAGCKK